MPNCQYCAASALLRRDLHNTLLISEGKQYSAASRPLAHCFRMLKIWLLIYLILAVGSIQIVFHLRSPMVKLHRTKIHNSHINFPQTQRVLARIADGCISMDCIRSTDPSYAWHRMRSPSQPVMPLHFSGGRGVVALLFSFHLMQDQDLVFHSFKK